MKFQLLPTTTTALLLLVSKGHSNEYNKPRTRLRGSSMQMNYQPIDIDNVPSYSLNELLELDSYPTLNLPNKGEPLRQPEQIIAEDDGRSGPKTVKVALHYDVVKYIGPSYTTLLKLFNGGMGPTIRVKPGDSLIVELYNDLEGPLGHYGHNQYQLPNTTNIHLHGPHISGMSPGDDIFVRVDPGENFTYQYIFGEDHMPGTHVSCLLVVYITFVL